MARHSSWRQGASPAWFAWIALIALQLAASPFLYDQDALQALRAVGWAAWLVTCVFAWWPVVALRGGGGVAKGESYTQTTRLVDTGPYAIVRHPQYLSFILLSLSLALIVQHWLVIILGAFAIPLVYLRIVPEAERLNLRRFGEEYGRYAEKVPRLNLFAGLARLLRTPSL